MSWQQTGPIATFIGTTTERTDQLEECAIGSRWFDETLGYWFSKSGAGTWVVEVGKVGIDQTTPGTTNQVQASANITTIKTTLTRPSDTTAYTAGDTFAKTGGATAGGETFTAAAHSSGGTGKITDAIIGLSAKTALQGEIWVFDQAVGTVANDNAAIALAAADLLNLVAVIPFNINDTGTVAGFSYVNGIDARFTCVGSANLRYVVKVINAPTPASAEVLSICLHVEN